MAYENLLVEKKEGIGYITINRPKVLNALSIKTVRELTDAFEKMGRDKNVAVVILTGSGDKSFVAGADIPEFMKLRPAP
jgi:enoyl-CoA hydratase